MADDFGDRMKLYETRETGRTFMPGLPIYARIDGRGFSKFTKGMARPYDIDMTRCMSAATKYLVEETNAKIGYTQSDEISLVWFVEDPKSEVFFGGKIQKMNSILASMATIYFAKTVFEKFGYEHLCKLPHFDCRIFQLPNKTEAANVILWREKDATKNAISMAARACYSHKELNGKNGSEKQEMLFQKGINFNDYPPFFKRGLFYQRKLYEKYLTDVELSRIPLEKRPDGPVLRSVIENIAMPPFGQVKNRVGVIFDGEEPVTET